MKRYRIIYEDEALLVVDKPSGLLTIPTAGEARLTLTNLLNEELRDRAIAVSAHPCHRLDRETSGVIVYAKGKKMQGLVMEEFRCRRVRKTYVAFVHGAVKKDFDTLRASIYNRNRRREEPAVTRYRVTAREAGYTVVDVEPETGRTNQIRIHFAKIGHPLVGESVYAFRRDFRLRFKRVALHAARIAFRHPVTGREVSFTAALPADMQKFRETDHSA